MSTHRLHPPPMLVGRRAAGADGSRQRPDRDRGSGFLLGFVVAILIMVGAAWLVGAVGRMWVLIPVVALHLLLTGAVLAGIARLLDAGGDG